MAWITVQKVSNLILNMNLYLADPATEKLTFLKSVDIRGNTDKSWSRSLRYLLDTRNRKRDHVFGWRWAKMDSPSGEPAASTMDQVTSRA